MKLLNQNKMKQTAVEWLIEQMKKCNMTVSVHNTSHQNVMDFYKAIDQAKEMEKEQAERMYSEEEVENILIEYVKTNPTKPYRVVQWFEQFKKK